MMARMAVQLVWFKRDLRTHDHLPLCEAAPLLTCSAHPDYLSLTPARHDTDGFFAAVMQREAAPAAPPPVAEA